MPTSVLTLEQHFKAPESLDSNAGSVRNRKATPEATAFPPNNTVFNGAADRPKKLNFFSQKLKEFESQFETELIWTNIIIISAMHLALVICLIIGFKSITWRTFLFNLFMSTWVALSVTGGVHRLWTHRTYTANLPLRIFLMISFSMSGMNPIFEWVRDHRVHHKYSETAADPHDANRGFFFAHVGWLMCRKKREVIEKGKTVDMSDILADPVARFHTRFYTSLKYIFCFILPTIIPMYFWNETFFIAFTVVLLRYILGLNFTWLVNSAAHLYGNKPYDKNIGPAQNWFVSLVSGGEGWHNYHHVFPWDYKAAELGNYGLNFTTMWIDLFARLGWAWDLKTVSPSLVKGIVEHKGDGSHEVYHPKEDKSL